MLSEVDLLRLWHAQMRLRTSFLPSSFSRESDFTFATMVEVKHGENGKDTGKAVEENFMKTAVKKTKAKAYV